MKEKQFQFSYSVYDSIDELPVDKKDLLLKARQATQYSYAPYSNFHVGAIAKMKNGEFIQGTNQENASFPVGMCAERVLLSSVSSRFPDLPVQSIAISYNSDHHSTDHPISPCGICRQTLQEYESRMNHPIELILGGMTGPVYVIDTVSKLLPLAFTGDELK
jgi:cytidine deaminase